MFIFLLTWLILQVLTCVGSEFNPCLTSHKWSDEETDYILIVHARESYVYASCRLGFTVAENSLTQCDNGHLIKPLPKCQKVVNGCADLPIPKHGTKNCDPNAPAVGSKCKFDCKKTHYLTGSKERFCVENLQWTGTSAWCNKRPACPIPPPLLHGKVIDCSAKTEPLLGDSCSFQCNEGFELVGPRKLICRQSRRMTDEYGRVGYPLCIEKESSQFRATSKEDLSHKQAFNGLYQAHYSAVLSCSIEKGGCGHFCHQGKGFVVCTCRKGFILEERNGKTCTDVDECMNNSHHCQHNCTNTVGSYKCSCKQGYRLIDSFHCDTYTPSLGSLAIHPYGQPRQFHRTIERKQRPRPSSYGGPCYNRNGGCSQECLVENGKAKCSCFAGHVLDSDSKTCREIGLVTSPLNSGMDEMPSKRPFQYKYDVLPDSVVRSCNIRNGGCSDFCDEHNGSVVCTCRAGYQLMTDQKQCVDIDECKNENFGCYYKCFNMPGGALCECPPGFKLHSDGKNCEDIDECTQHSHQCEQICHNTIGNYSCSCQPGYITIKEFKCQRCRKNSYRSENDVSCMECPQNSYTNLEGRTSIGDCHCLTGYSGNPALNIPCTDIDECSINNFECSDMCLNTPGSAFCSCPQGFKLKDDQKTCQDIDECSIKNGGCQGLCHNTNGSFICSCTEGYSVSEKDLYSCSDVDECTVDNGGCSHHCVNFPGSYHCTCPDGYHLAEEAKTCFVVHCPKIVVPNHSEVRCFSKYDSSNKTVFKTGEMPGLIEFSTGTYIRLKCNKGYQPDKSITTVECLSNGKWNATLPNCVGLLCGPLIAPENGALHPPECTRGYISVKQNCYFTCKKGYRLIGRSVFTCKNDLTWTDEALPTCNRTKIVPFISCPEDVTIKLEPNKSSVTLTIHPPHTNEERYEVKPEWVDVGNPTTFSAGKTNILFNVTSSQNKSMRCKMSVTVLDKEPPVFNRCPVSFDVEGNNVFVNWEEPTASDNVGIESIRKNLEPNSTLSSGVHIVEYIAKDFAGNTAKCSFEINVTSSECGVLLDPENGEANCMDMMFGRICEPFCYTNFTRGLNATDIFVCDDSGMWSRENFISPCLPECPYGELWSSEFQQCEGNFTLDLNITYSK